MELEGLEPGKVYWLTEEGQKIVQVVFVEANDDGTVNVRLPNGSIQPAFPDELEPV